MRFVLTWLLFAGLWILLSGYFDAVHLTFGLVSVTLVALISSRHLASDGPMSVGVLRLLRLAAYVPWLLWQITLANVDVLLRVVGLRPIDPRIARIESDLSSDFGTVTFANSITLTPGTVTVEVEDGHLIVHAISPEALEGLANGEMLARVRRVEGGPA